MNLLLKTTVVAIGILAGMYLSGCGSDNTSPGEDNGVGSCMTHNGTEYCDVTSPYTGRVWLNKNLGASRVCTAYDDTECYGDYYQWGRKADGHEDITRRTTSTQAGDVYNAGCEFIIRHLDWAWAGVDDNGGTRSANWSNTYGNYACPAGYRVPTIDELKAELLDAGSAEIHNMYDAFSSFLKLPSAGYRHYFSGTLDGQGSWGGYVWSSSSASGFYASGVDFVSAHADWSDGPRAGGHSVRCLRD